SEPRAKNRMIFDNADANARADCHRGISTSTTVVPSVLDTWAWPPSDAARSQIERGIKSPSGTAAPAWFSILTAMLPWLDATVRVTAVAVVWRRTLLNASAAI